MFYTDRYEDVKNDEKIIFSGSVLFNKMKTTKSV